MSRQKRNFYKLEADPLPMVLKKFITIKKPSSIQAYIYAKQHTEWTDDRLFEELFDLFGMVIGCEHRKLKEAAFEALSSYAKSQKSFIEMKIEATKKEARSSRQNGRPVKIPK